MIYPIYKKNPNSLFLLCLLLFSFHWNSCTKNSNASSNKAYLSVTNAIQDGSPVDILIEGSSILPVSQPLLGSDTSTGSPGSPYLTVTGGIHNFKVTADRITYLINGNIELENSQYYSVFLYDSLFGGKIHSLILKDNIPNLPDTISGFRFLNLSPSADTLFYVLTQKNHLLTPRDTTILDTIPLGYIPFIGPNPVPSSLSRFKAIKSGGYYLNTATDTSNVLFNFKPIDSIYLAGGKSYTIYSKGFFHGSGSDTLTTRTLQHD